MLVLLAGKFDLYIGQKKDIEVNLGEPVMMQIVWETEMDLV